LRLSMAANFSRRVSLVGMRAIPGFGIVSGQE
jgi:hypothetical protein